MAWEITTGTLAL